MAEFFQKARFLRLCARSPHCPAVRNLAHARRVQQQRKAAEAHAVIRSDDDRLCHLRPTLVFNGQGNDLAAYLGETAVHQAARRPSPRRRAPDGLDINGQICFDPKRPEPVRRGRGHAPGHDRPSGLGHLRAVAARRSASCRSRRSASSCRPTSRATTTPRTTAADSSPTAASSRPTSATRRPAPGDGQLIVWFPPFESARR